ncbi:hypothetical protein [Bradyrhizobium sp. C9]|nr:hypothetical protein [Bradyrhizobium sp. C9]
MTDLDMVVRDDVDHAPEAVAVSVIWLKSGIAAALLEVAFLIQLRHST